MVMSQQYSESQNGVLWYPRLEKNPTSILVELFDVRAADNLIVSYDYERDGWVIARGLNPDREVAFIRSWEEFEEGNNVGIFEEFF